MGQGCTALKDIQPKVFGRAGLGSGARVAAAVGQKCRGNIAGFVFISYPIKVRYKLSHGPDADGNVM